MPDLRVVIFYGIFESFFLIYLGISFFGLKITRLKLILAALYYTGIPFIIRWIYGYLDIPLGTHVFLNMFAMAIILRLTTRKDWVIAFGASFFIFVLLFIGEVFIMLPIKKFVYLNKNVYFQVFWGYMGLIPAAVLLAIIKYFDVNIFNIGNKNTLDGVKENLENQDEEQYQRGKPPQ